MAHKYDNIQEEEIRKRVSLFEEFELYLQGLGYTWTVSTYQNEELIVYLELMGDAVIVYEKVESCNPVTAEELATCHVERIIRPLHIIRDVSRIITNLDEFKKLIHGS